MSTAGGELDIGEERVVLVQNAEGREMQDAAARRLPAKQILRRRFTHDRQSLMGRHAVQWFRPPVSTPGKASSRGAKARQPIWSAVPLCFQCEPHRRRRCLEELIALNQEAIPPGSPPSALRTGDSATPA